MNPEPPHTQNCYWMPTVVFGKSHAFDRDCLVRELNSQGIAVRPFFYPLTLMPMFPQTPANEVSRDLHSRAINLPSAFDLTASAAADVIARMRTYFSRHVPQ
jgi:perosamine synthetase